MKQIYFFAVLCLVILVLMFPSDDALKKGKSSPRGIVSMEFAASPATANKLRAEWDTTFITKPAPGTPCEQVPSKSIGDQLLHNAKTNTYLDFAFIVLYGLLLWSFNIHINKQKPARKRWVTFAIIAACVFDCIENLFMLLFMGSAQKLVVIGLTAFSIAAALKFALLLAAIFLGIISYRWVLSKLAGLTRLLKDISYIFRYSPLTIISLLVLFFTAWVSDQGQDLLLTINNNALGPAILYVVIIILAVMNWYFPKFYLGVKWKSKKLSELFTAGFDFPFTMKTKPNWVAVPRIFGVLTFLIPAFGIIKVLIVFGVVALPSSLPLVLLIVTTMLIQAGFKRDVFTDFYDNRRWLFNLVCIACLLAPLVAFIFTTRGPGDLILIFIGLFFYALLFAFVTANRNSMSLRIPMLDSAKITPAIWLATLAPVLLFVFYFFCNTQYVPAFKVTFLTFTLVMSGIITYYAMFTILNVIGKKINVNISLLMIVACLVTASNCTNHFHYADQQPIKRVTTITLEQYIKKWLEDRYVKAKQDSPYHIYIVNTYGGGIRASSWTCFVMSKLDSLQQLKNKELFQDHVLAYSGASGGTVGASILCANGFSSNRRITLQQYNTFYSNDFLTPLLTGMIGNDIWYAALGITCGNDRSKVQEHLWEEYFYTQFGSNKYGSLEDSLWDGSNTRVPLLFSNTTNVKMGCKGIMAPVLLDSNDFPGVTFIRNLMDTQHTLKLSSSAFLSARFPYLSPAGGFDENHHFLDGGIVENSGAETALQVFNVLRRMIDTAASGKYKGYFRVSILSLHNAYHHDTDVIERKKNLSQVMAPVTAAVGVGLNGNTTRTDNVNRRYFNADASHLPAFRYEKIEPIVEQISLEPKFPWQDSDKVQVPLPLGWSISDIALRRMMESVNLLCDTNRGNPAYNCDYRKVGQLYYIVNPRQDSLLFRR